MYGLSRRFHQLDKGEMFRKRTIVSTIIVIAGLALVSAVFLAPHDRASELVTLVTGLAWPLVLVLGLALLWPQVRELASEVVTRTRKGSSLQLASFLSLGELPAQAERIPSPGATESVTLSNVALLHTSFLRQDKTREYSDGRIYYQFEVIVIAPESVMIRIDSVVYHLEDAWPPELRTKTIRNRESRFKMKELANGTSIVRADVKFIDDEEPVRLNRFIDLRPDGPRL
jgi:hypothetical protein